MPNNTPPITRQLSYHGKKYDKYRIQITRCANLDFEQKTGNDLFSWVKMIIKFFKYVLP